MKKIKQKEFAKAYEEYLQTGKLTWKNKNREAWNGHHKTAWKTKTNKKDHITTWKKSEGKWKK